MTATEAACADRISGLRRLAYEDATANAIGASPTAAMLRMLAKSSATYDIPFRR